MTWFLLSLAAVLALFLLYFIVASVIVHKINTSRRRRLLAMCGLLEGVIDLHEMRIEHHKRLSSALSLAIRRAA